MNYEYNYMTIYVSYEGRRMSPRRSLRQQELRIYSRSLMYVHSTYVIYNIQKVVYLLSDGF